MASRGRLSSSGVRRIGPVAPRRRRDPIWFLVMILVSASVITASFVVLPQAIGPTAPPVTHAVAIDSLPTGIRFTIDGSSYTTPEIVHLSPTTHTIVMPRSVVLGNATYNFQRWSDGELNTTRRIDLQADVALSASFETNVATPLVAYDSYVGVLSLSTNGGHKFFSDSRGKLIVVYINSLGAIAVTANNGDPAEDAWMPPFMSARGYLRPAAVLLTDDEMHVLAEFRSNITELIVHFSRDADGNILGGTFDPAVTIDIGGAYPAAIRAHDGSIWAVWNHRDGAGTSFSASRLIAGHWALGSSWTLQQIAVDTVTTEPFYPYIIEREDNFKLYVFANRGQESMPRDMAFVSAVFSGGTWMWRLPNLEYETIAARGIVDAVSAAWDPVHKLVVVVNDHFGTPSYLAFTLDANDLKTRFNTPRFAIANNDWGTILVDSLTGDYYLLFMETVIGTVNGRACYTRWNGTAWSDFVVVDQNSADVGFQVRSGGGPNKDFIFGRGFDSGSVQIRYASIA